MTFTKRKGVSKKNKKAWRKHCDITDVEKFLEDQRVDERIGNIQLKPDSALFVIDTAGDDYPGKEKVLSAKEKKRAKLEQPPTCFNVLLPDSKVIISTPNNTPKTPKTRDVKRFQKSAQLKANNIVKPVSAKKSKIKKNKCFRKDIWGEEVLKVKEVPSTLLEEFISPEARLHNLLPEQRLRPKPPLSSKITSRAAVPPPHPGVSYNPSYKEHQDLMQQVINHEKKMIDREAHIHRVTTGMFSKVTTEQKENQWREEMGSGLALPDKSSNVKSDSDTDDDIKSVNPPVKNKKKDAKTRRKQRERLVEKERLKREKIDKKKITDLYKLRKIASDIKTTEKKQQEVRVEKMAVKDAKAKTALPELNAHKLRPKEPDFVEPEQLTGDLRHMAPKTNLLRERYESLQHRGAIAGSKLMMKKKRKVKSYFKPGHKVTDQDIERYTTLRPNNKTYV